MKIILSKSQWNNIGIKAGWIKSDQVGGEKIEEQIRKNFLDKYPDEPSIPPLSQFILAKTDRQYNLVNIDVEKFDKLFQNDIGFYINRGGTNGIHGRYERFGDFLRTKTPIEASLVHISEDMQTASFSNGRHRYAFLRDMGMKIMPVAMDNESFIRAKKLGIAK